MRRFSILFSFVSITVLVTIIVAVLQFRTNLNREIYQTKLEIAADYSTDAAVQQMLLTEDLDLDYTSYSTVDIDPNIALDTFVECMLLNYGYEPVDKLKTEFKNDCISCFLVVGCDGYYVASSQPIDDYTTNSEAGTIQFIDWQSIDSSKDYINLPLSHPADEPPDNRSYGYSLAFSQKMPYTYIDEFNKRVYALEINNRNIKSICKLNDSIEYNDYTGAIGSSSLPPEIENQSDRLVLINRLLSKRINYELRKANEERIGWVNNILIPSEVLAMRQSNLVKGASVIACLQNIRYGSTISLDTFSIGGTRIDSTKQILCYEDRGVKWYCYASNAPASVTIDRIVGSPENAAKLGYHYDYRYIGGKKVK